MDIDAQEKHIRALLAFKAWAEPILLALEQDAALVEAEIEQVDEPEAHAEGASSSNADDSGASGEQEPVAEDAPVVSEETKAPELEPDAVPTEEAAPVAEQTVSEAAPVEEQPVEQAPVAQPEDETPPPAAA